MTTTGINDHIPRDISSSKTHSSVALLMDAARERDRLRAAQASAVMPLIGQLLDAWECCSQACREELPELDKQLRRINRAMEHAGDAEPGCRDCADNNGTCPHDGHKCGA